jgi:hypothetical protein
LTLVAPLGNLHDRDAQYETDFLNGEARWYHMPVRTTDLKSVERNAMREVRYCAIATDLEGYEHKTITHLYEVISVCLKKRHEITAEQSGKDGHGNNAEYWLFKLAYARTLTPAPSCRRQNTLNLC